MTDCSLAVFLVRLLTLIMGNCGGTVSLVSVLLIVLLIVNLLNLITMTFGLCLLNTVTSTAVLNLVVLPYTAVIVTKFSRLTS